MSASLGARTCRPLIGGPEAHTPGGAPCLVEPVNPSFGPAARKEPFIVRWK